MLEIQVSAAIRTGLARRSVVVKCSSLFIREQTRLMVPRAKEVRKQELLTHTLYRPAKSPEEKNGGKPSNETLAI